MFGDGAGAGADLSGSQIIRPTNQAWLARWRRNWRWVDENGQGRQGTILSSSVVLETSAHTPNTHTHLYTHTHTHYSIKYIHTYPHPDCWSNTCEIFKDLLRCYTRTIYVPFFSLFPFCKRTTSNLDHESPTSLRRLQLISFRVRGSFHDLLISFCSLLAPSVILIEIPPSLRTTGYFDRNSAVARASGQNNQTQIPTKICAVLVRQHKEQTPYFFPVTGQGEKANLRYV